MRQKSKYIFIKIKVICIKYGDHLITLLLEKHLT